MTTCPSSRVVEMDFIVDEFITVGACMEYKVYSPVVEGIGLVLGFRDGDGNLVGTWKTNMARVSLVENEVCWYTWQWPGESSRGVGIKR